MIKKILIVDDSPISVKIIKSCVPKDMGYELYDAADGQMGVEKYKEIKPDLTFMDLTMPVMTGFQALEEIMKMDTKAMVIILTADVQIKAIAKAHDLGAFSVLKKPPSKESVAGAIKEAEEALASRG
ncbi:MAG TPA: response regulator [Smithella sp.]|jgi:two-component system chemotaxis response regulator CheY|nr:response regulator [Smithella sp.]NMC97257.1 response regulator [Deltaproteobacteria bacterium]HNQ66476.1 response regulator [Smithella sp.]HOE31805.1 response regulator [Smithella sp.]HOG09450.1 response regulator [Smithella sp.]